MSAFKNFLRVFLPKEFKSEDPLYDLQRSIKWNLSEAACANAARRCFEDKDIHAILVDPVRSAAQGKEVLLQAGLSQLLVKDEDFDDWRLASPENQALFIRKMLRVRMLLSDKYLHAI